MSGVSDCGGEISIVLGEGGYVGDDDKKFSLKYFGFRLFFTAFLEFYVSIYSYFPRTKRFFTLRFFNYIQVQKMDLNNPRKKQAVYLKTGQISL